MSDQTLADDTELNGGPSSMKISDAKNVFHLFGPSLQQDFEDLARLFRTHGIGLPIANSNYLHALSTIALMFRHTDHSLQMVTGSAREGLPQCLHPIFRNMLSRIKKNDGKARVVVVDTDADDLESLAKDFPDTLHVARGRIPPGARLTHFIVCDDDMVRDEKYHPKLEDDSDANVIKADVYFSNPDVASMLSRKFEAIWDVVRPSA